MATKHAGAVLQALAPEDFPVLNLASQELVPGRKHPENPVLCGRPGHCDGTRCKVYGTVLYDERDRLFRMWYCGGSDTPDAIRRTQGSRGHVGYAYSEDGVDWTRPSLVVVEYAGSLYNNLVLLDAQAPNVFLCDIDPDAPSRVLMITEHGLGTHRIRVLASDAGVHWTQSQEHPAETSTKRGTHEPFSILFDPRDPDPSRRWKGYSLLHASHGGYRGRAVRLFFAEDPHHWLEHPIQPILSPSAGMESGIHIAHVSRFHDTYVMIYDAMEPNHHTQAEVAVSRDGVRFQRVQNGVKLLSNGPADEADAWTICVSLRSLFPHQGQIWWYYTTSAATLTRRRHVVTAGRLGTGTRPSHNGEKMDSRHRVARGSDVAEVTSVDLIAEADGPCHVWLNAAVPRSTGGLVLELFGDLGTVLETTTA